MSAPSTFTGKNIETAIHKAATAMGVKAEDLKYEVLAGASGGYALIKVIGASGKAAAKTAPAMVESLSGDGPSPDGDQRPPPRAERSERSERSERGRGRGDRRERRGDRGRDRDRGDRRGGDRRRRDEEPIAIPLDGPREVEVVVEEDEQLGPYGEKAKELIAGVLTRMGLGMKVVVSESDDEVVADMQSGPYHEALLARDGELLDAIEHLVDKATSMQVPNQEGGPRKKVHLDSQGHRAKADVDLALAARHMAERAMAEDRTMKLGPLDPRARRVVHLTLKEMDGVITKSEGEGVFRRVCIIPKAPPVDALESAPDERVASADDEGEDDAES